MSFFEVHLWLPDIVVYDPPRTPELIYRHWDGGADDWKAAVAAARAAWQEDYGYELPEDALVKVVDLSPVSVDNAPSERRRHLDVQRQRYIDSYQCPKCGRPVLDVSDSVPAPDCMYTVCRGCNSHLVRDAESREGESRRPWRIEFPEPDDIRA